METYILSNTALSISGMFFCSSRGESLTEWKLYFYFYQPTSLVIDKVLFYLETNKRYDATRTINPFTPLVQATDLWPGWSAPGSEHLDKKFHYQKQHSLVLPEESQCNHTQPD